MELMIATVIGLLLLSAVMAAFVSSSKIYRTQEAMARVQETGRFVLEILPQDIREAGYGVDEGRSAITGYRDAVTASKSIGIAKVAKARGEVLYILAHGFGGGGNIAYFVAPDAGDSNQNALYKNNQALVEGVESVVFRYGLDSDADRLVDHFVATEDVSDWQQVRAIRFSFLVGSAERFVVDQAQILPAPFTGFNTEDRKLYRVFSGTVALRNRLP